MALTPEDIVNKRFEATKFREGYDQDEVDDYLDEIVVELRRLLKENRSLRKRLAAGGLATGTAPVIDSKTEVLGAKPGQATTVIASRQTGMTTGQHQVKSQIPARPETSADMKAAQESASSVILMAQQLHDQHVNEGIAKRDELISQAEDASQQLMNDAQDHRDQIVDGLQKEKAILETKIEQLRAFDRDYRARLKAYIESHLRELDVSGSIVNEMRPMASMPAPQPVASRMHQTSSVPGIPTTGIPRLSEDEALFDSVTAPHESKTSPTSTQMPLVKPSHKPDKAYGSTGKRDSSHKGEERNEFEPVTTATGSVPKFTTKAYKKGKK
ncbi:MAG: DivIVA domain-containing protein [Micrococcaceae bacterium]